MGNSLYCLSAFRAGVAVARVIPRSAGQWIGRQIGVASYRRRPQAQAAIRANLHAVTGKEGAELDALCVANVRNFSHMVADYFYCASRKPAEAARLVQRWRGFEHLEAARARGKGVIIVTGHLGHWELGGILLTERGLPMTVITLDEPSTALTEWRDDYRRRSGIQTIAVGPGREFGFVEMIQTLRRNECLAMLVDRPYAGTGAPVSFFGRPTQFSSGPALLWQHTGAAVVPAFVVREADGVYSSFAEPIIPMESGSDPRAAQQENTQRVASAFEDIIRRFPEQWFNYTPIWPETPAPEPAPSAAPALS